VALPSLVYLEARGAAESIPLLIAEKRPKLLGDTFLLHPVGPTLL